MPNLVTNPTAGDVHVNAPLTNFSQKYLQQANMFVSLRAMPQLPVAKQSDLYYEFSRADFYRDEAEKRADGAESAGGGFALSTAPYFADVYAFHKDVTDRQRANQDSPVQLDNSATQFVTQKLMLKRESEFLGTFFVPSVWFNGGTSASAGTTPGTKWDVATSDPITDIRLGIRTVQGITGFRPNRVLFSRDAWDTFLDNDAVLDRIKGGATVDIPAVVMRRLVAQVLEIDMVEVVDSVVNTAIRGATEATAFTGNSQQCLIYYAPLTVSLEEPTAGVAFNWTGLLGNTDNGMRIKRFRTEPTASDRVEGEMAFDNKVVAPELGYLIIAVLT